jgi:hypothetical protein
MATATERGDTSLDIGVFLSSEEHGPAALVRRRVLRLEDPPPEDARMKQETSEESSETEAGQGTHAVDHDRKLFRSSWRSSWGWPPIWAAP